MIITVNHNLNQPGSDDADSKGLTWKASHIMHGRGRRKYWSGECGLSIKLFSGGNAFYDVGQGHYLVDDSSYLVLNHRQHYSITIDSETPVASSCIFFAAGFVEEVQHSLNTKAQHLLDNPENANSQQVNFFERLYPHDDVLSPTLTNLRDSLMKRKDEPGWLIEQLHSIANRLLYVHQGVCSEIETIPALRVSTREELYRRLYRAHDFVASVFTQRTISLDEMARVACLSPNHFLRTFKQVFHQTPHQYLTALRIQHAQKLLLQTDHSVTEICYIVGFESLGSFSKLFRRHVGVSPERYRRQKGDFGEA